jgi:tRNA dimethylallyltransferase
LKSDKIPVICIVGSTASGKTDLAVNIAKKMNGEIISADSMQIYKEFNISTAKPTLNQQSGVKHHCIDIVSVKENFSVAKYVSFAEKIIKDIFSRGKIPILCGGTGLYIDSLIKNIPFEKGETNIAIRNRIINYINVNNAGYFFDKLKKIDPSSAKKINTHDHKRICRAIEFYYTNGYPIYRQVENFLKSEPHYNVCKIGLNFKDRSILYDRINKRVDFMVKNGILNEMFSIKDIGDTAKFSIGYKELLPFINAESSLKKCTEKLKMETRRYAKRQITWFKRDLSAKWFNVDEYENVSNLFCDVQKCILNSGILGHVSK